MKRTLRLLLPAVLGTIVLAFGAPLPGHAWTYYFAHNLHRGMTGEDVVQLQTYLAEQGYFHYPDDTGYFGPITQTAVAQWQAANGIAPPAGFFGPISRAFVNGEDAASTPTTSTIIFVPPPGATSTIVAPPSCPRGCGGVTMIPSNNNGDAPTGPVSVSVSGATSTFADATSTFIATVANATNTAVTWSAVFGTINASGVYTPSLLYGTSTVTDTITATSVADPSKSATTSVAVASGLAAEWPLNEGTGTLALDLTTNHATGTWHGTPASGGTYYTTSSIDGATVGDFNGTDDYLDMGSSTLFDSQTVTMLAWVRVNNDSIQGTVMGKEEQYKFAAHNGQFEILQSCDGTAWSTNTAVSGSDSVGSWTMAAFVVDGTHAVNRFYINGSLVSTSANCGTITHFNGNDFEIGGYNGANGLFNGAIRDARFYNRALTTAQVQAYYNGTKPSLAVSVSVSPTSTSLLAGATTTFAATVSNASDTAVTWSAVNGSINATSGVYTAPLLTGTSTITDTITATSVADNTKTATATVTVSSGIAAWWPFTEGTGTIAYDASGAGSNANWSGTPAGTSGYYAAGKTGGTYAGYFNGTNDEATATALAALSGDHARTVTLWLNTATSGQQVFFDSGDINNVGQAFQLALTSQGGIGSSPATDTPGFDLTFWGDDIYIPGLYLGNGTWHFVAVSLNGYSVTISVDGVTSSGYVWNGTSWSSLQSQPFTLPIVPNTTANPVMIGAGRIQLWTTGTTQFAGSLDDVRVYGRALGASELQSLYTSTKPPVSVSITPTSTALVGGGATTTFAATVSNATNTAVTWSAVYGSINSSGLYTAPSDIGTSTITDTITATSVADGTKTATATVTVSSGLVAWVPLNEGTGSTAHDLASSSRIDSWSGTQSGNFGYYSQVTVSSSLSYVGAFDGSDNSVTGSGGYGFGTGDFSVSFWMYPFQWGGVTQGIIGDKTSDSDNGWQVYNDSGTHTNTVGMRIGNTQVTLYASSSVALEHWQLWTFVRHNGTAYWYLNGAQDSASSSALNASSTGGSFSIGTAQTWSGSYYWGGLYDIRVYDRALSPSEVQGIYNLPKPTGGIVVTTNPAA